MDNIKTEIRTINELFAGKTKFLIPDYQRPYTWTEEHSSALWLDVSDFALNNADFDSSNSEYFLGTMVTFYNSRKQDEIIDGQQRITTLLLLMRAFYAALDDKNSPPIKNDLGKCVWIADERGVANKTALKITSEVLQEGANEELAAILLTGTTDRKSSSNYAVNYRYFQLEISKLTFDLREIFAARLLNNCYVIKIRADSQDTALQMFATINDKGCPLTDTDIFKSVLYKDALARGGISAKNNLIERWDMLERRSNCLFRISMQKVTPLEFCFMTYTYKVTNLQKKRGINSFFSANNYASLRDPNTLDEIFAMLDFMQDLKEQNQLRFPAKVLRQTYILLTLRTASSVHALTSYFLKKHDAQYSIDNEAFSVYLDNLIAFLIGAACTCSTSVNNLSSYGFAPIASLAEEPTKRLDSQLFSKGVIENNLRNFTAMKGKTLAKKLVINWWTFKNDNQELIDLDTPLTCEHIFAKKRAEFEPMDDRRSLELLGNLALLERSSNIRAADYRFSDKKKFYLGFTDAKGRFIKGTANRELQTLAQTKSDFNEVDIVNRNEQMIAEILATLDRYHFLTK